MNKNFTNLHFIVGGLIIVIFLSLLMSLPVMLLWNYCLVPAVNGVNTIGWLQAYGITFLCSLLIKDNSIKIN